MYAGHEGNSVVFSCAMFRMENGSVFLDSSQSTKVFINNYGGVLLEM